MTFKEELAKIHKDLAYDSVGRLPTTKNYLIEQATVKAIKAFNKIVPEKKTDPDNLAGDPSKWEVTIAGYNQCVDQIERAINE
jgi:hypothetical protein